MFRHTNIWSSAAYSILNWRSVNKIAGCSNKIYLYFFVVALSNIKWKCLNNCNMLTQRSWDSAVFKVLLNNIYCAVITWNVVWNVELNNKVYTTLRQVFFKVNIRLFMNNILNVQTHNLHNIFLTVGRQNSWLFQQKCFHFGENINFKKDCEKMKNNSMLETFDSEVSSLRRMRKNKLIILNSLQKKSFPYLVLFVCRCWNWIVKHQLKVFRKL